MLITVVMLFTTSVKSEEKKKTLSSMVSGDCYSEHKISPKTLVCSIKKGFRNMYTKEDGSLNVLGKFFNAKTLADLNK